MTTGGEGIGRYEIPWVHNKVVNAVTSVGRNGLIIQNDQRVLINPFLEDILPLGRVKVPGNQDREVTVSLLKLAQQRV